MRHANLLQSSEYISIIPEMFISFLVLQADHTCLLLPPETFLSIFLLVCSVRLMMSQAFLNTQCQQGSLSLGK